MGKTVSTKFSEFSFLVQRFFGLVQNFVLIQNRLTQTFVLQHKRKTNICGSELNLGPTSQKWLMIYIILYKYRPKNFRAFGARYSYIYIYIYKLYYIILYIYIYIYYIRL